MFVAFDAMFLVTIDRTNMAARRSSLFTLQYIAFNYYNAVKRFKYGTYFLFAF